MYSNVCGCNIVLSNLIVCTLVYFAVTLIPSLADRLSYFQQYNFNNSKSVFLIGRKTKTVKT